MIRQGFRSSFAGKSESRLDRDMWTEGLILQGEIERIYLCA